MLSLSSFSEFLKISNNIEAHRYNPPNALGNFREMTNSLIYHQPVFKPVYHATLLVAETCIDDILTEVADPTGLEFKFFFKYRTTRCIHLALIVLLSTGLVYVRFWIFDYLPTQFVVVTNLVVSWALVDGTVKSHRKAMQTLTGSLLVLFFRANYPGHSEHVGCCDLLLIGSLCTILVLICFHAYWIRKIRNVEIYFYQYAKQKQAKSDESAAMEQLESQWKVHNFMPNWTTEKTAIDRVLAQMTPPKETDKKVKKELNKEPSEESSNQEMNVNVGGEAPEETTTAKKAASAAQGTEGSRAFDAQFDSRYQACFVSAETPQDTKPDDMPAQTKFDLKVFEATKKAITISHGHANCRATFYGIISVYVVHVLLQGAICLSFAFNQCDQFGR